MRNKDGKTAVIVGTVTDDKRMFETPKLTVCALRFTAGARARIVKAGGKYLFFASLHSPTVRTRMQWHFSAHARLPSFYSLFPYLFTGTQLSASPSTMPFLAFLCAHAAPLPSLTFLVYCYKKISLPFHSSLPRMRL